MPTPPRSLPARPSPGGRRRLRTSASTWKQRAAIISASALVCISTWKCESAVIFAALPGARKRGGAWGPNNKGHIKGRTPRN